MDVCQKFYIALFICLVGIYLNPNYPIRNFMLRQIDSEWSPYSLDYRLPTCLVGTHQRNLTLSQAALNELRESERIIYKYHYTTESRFTKAQTFVYQLPTCTLDEHNEKGSCLKSVDQMLPCNAIDAVIITLYQGKRCADDSTKMFKPSFYTFDIRFLTEALAERSDLKLPVNNQVYFGHGSGFEIKSSIRNLSKEYEKIYGIENFYLFGLHFHSLMGEKENVSFKW